MRHINIGPRFILSSERGAFNFSVSQGLLATMPHGIQLSDREKVLIDAYNDSGKGVKEIARKIGRSHNVILNFL